MNRSPTPDGMFRGCFRNVRHAFRGRMLHYWQSVRNIIAIRSQRNGKPQAAVGADLSCPQI